MFAICDFIDYLNISKEVFYKFMVEVYRMYDQNDNPFHNFDHGFNVTHGMFCMINKKIGSEHIDFRDKFTLLFSCLGKFIYKL